MAHSFFGGIHPRGYKELTCESAITPIDPKVVSIAMSQHIGAPCKPLVQVGERVLLGQKIGDGTVSLGRVGIEIFYRDRIAQCMGSQKEGGIAPVAFDGQGAGGSIGAAGLQDIALGFDTKGFHGAAGHFNIRAGLCAACDFDASAIGQKREGKEQTGDKLAGHAAINGISSALELACAADGMVVRAGEGTAHTLHFFPKRR